MRLVTSLSTLVVLAGLAIPLAAQTQLETASGKKIQGEVLSDDGSEIEFQLADGATVKMKYDLLTPGSIYTLKNARTPKDDGKAQLDLAEWCVTERLYEEARLHFREALAADASMSAEINAAVTAARKTASEELLARAKAAEADGKEREARRLLTIIVQELPLEPAAEEATKLLAADTAERKQHALDPDPESDSADAAAGSTRGAAAGSAGGANWSADVLKTLKPAIDSYHKALDANQAALTSKNQSSAIKGFDKALNEIGKARKAVDKVRGSAQDGDELSRALVVCDEKIKEVVVDTRINLADAYMLRSSYNQATDAVNKGLAEYPQDQRLMATRARITSAASNGDGGWVIVGGGGGGRGPR